MRRALGRISIIVAIIAAVAATVWWIAQPRPPEPPLLETLGQMDPDVASLLRELRVAVEENRNDAKAWGRLGMGYEANGFIGAARQAYGVASGLAPDEPRWHYRLALVLSRLGAHDAALAALDRVNTLAPEYAPAWCRRGAWLIDRGDAVGAEHAFQRALAIDPRHACASTGLARVHLERRDNAQAARLLEGMLEDNPGDRYALQLLGTAYRRLGRVDDAAFALAVGAAGEPTRHDPWSEDVGEFRRGFAAQLKAATAEAMAGNFNRALPLLEELRRRRPNDVSLANHTADVLTSAGRAKDAIRLLEPLIQATTANADTHVVLASAYISSGEPGRADEHASRAIALGASGTRAHEIRGMVAWRAGRTRDAARLFEHGLVRDPRDTRLPVWIALLDLEEGRPRQAVAILSEVLHRDPLNAEALAGVAMAQLALGEHEQATAALARAEQVAPGHPRVRAARARVDQASRR